MTIADVAEQRALLREAVSELAVIKSQLAEVMVQVKRTNGRVTNLEREQIKREEREAVLAEIATTTEKRLVRRTDGWRWNVGTLIACVVGGGSLAAVISHLLT